MRRYRVTVDDRSWTLDVHQVEADRFQVTVGDATFEAVIAEEGDLPGSAISPEIPAVAMGHPEPPPRVHAQPPARGAATPGTSTTRAGSDVLAAPLPGVVLEVRVTPGDVVARGAPLLVLEAMKMRNTIRAPRDAMVAEVAVEPGQPVAPGDTLVRLGTPG